MAARHTITQFMLRAALRGNNLQSVFRLRKSCGKTWFFSAFFNVTIIIADETGAEIQPDSLLVTVNGGVANDDLNDTDFFFNQSAAIVAGSVIEVEASLNGGPVSKATYVVDKNLDSRLTVKAPTMMA